MTKPPRVWKHFGAAFAITLVGYVVVFNWIEHRRVKDGPWQITFQNASGQLELVINQGSEGIRGVRIEFTNAPITTNLAQTIQFTAGRKVPFEVPFGRCVFLDPLFLPGKVVLEIAGHELQIMPRVLVADGTEHPWVTTQSLTLGRPRREGPAE
jgi:hypothetical protein